MSKENMKTMLRCLICLVVLIPLVGWGSGGEAKAAEVKGELAKEQVLRYAGTVSELGSFHPDSGKGGGGSQAAHMLFNALVTLPSDLDEVRKFNVQPDLATSWEVADDGVTWTFHLRKGVQFHHGYGEMTADDVVFTYTVPNIDPAWAAEYRDYQELKVEAVDRYTVRIKTPRPNPFFLRLVSDAKVGKIVCKKAFEERGMEEFMVNPVGTGPFQIKEYQPRVHLILERHENYYKGKPVLERVEIILMDRSSAELALRKGEIQFINEGLREENWLKRMDGYGLDTITITREVFSVLQLDQKVKPLDDIRVRRAFHHAIDTSEIVEGLFGERMSRVLHGPLPDSFYGWTDDLPTYEYNPEEAKKLLAEAGYPDGFTIKSIITEAAHMHDPYVVIQEQLRKVGIKIELEVVPHGTFHTLIREGKSPVVFYTTGRLPFADIILHQFYDGDSIVTKPTGVTNFANFDAIDDLLDQARVEMNRDKQLKMYAQAQQKIMEDAISVPLFTINSTFAKVPWFDLGYDITKVQYSPDPMVVIDEKAKILSH